MQVLGQERKRHHNRGRVRTTGLANNEVKLLDLTPNCSLSAVAAQFYQKYNEGNIGEIEPCQLDALIHSNTIKKFQRSGKWVTIGVDPIREVRVDYLAVPKREIFPKKAKERK